MGAATSSSERFPELAFLRELLPVEPVSMLVQELTISGGVAGDTYIVCGAEGTRASTDVPFRVSIIAGGLDA